MYFSEARPPPMAYKEELKSRLFINHLGH
jgi:hypothetical protein